MSHSLSPVRVPLVLMLAPAWVRLSALLWLLVSVLVVRAQVLVPGCLLELALMSELL